MRGIVDTAERLVAWFAREQRDLPWRRTRDPYAIWVSEVMLQQTQVRTVIPYWERWMRELPDVPALAAADEARVLKLWEGLGYYRRARNLQAAARVIRDRHDGVFPRDPESILALPGIGRYTAGAIGSIAFGLPTPILDGNVIRVLTRLHALDEDPGTAPARRRLWDLASALVHAAAASARPEACSHLNQALMEVGALICTPRQPACERCPVAVGCAARKAGSPEAFPCTAPRTRVTARGFVVLVAQWGDRYCVRQRPADAVNGGLWEFPNVEVDGTAAPSTVVAQVMKSLFGDGIGHAGSGVEPERLGEVRHAITRYRIRQEVFRVRLARRGRAVAAAGRWESLAELRERPFTGAHRRILAWLD